MARLLISIAFVELLTMGITTCIQTFFYFKTIGFSTKWRGYRLVLIMLAVSVIEAILEFVVLNSTGLVGNVSKLIFLAVTILYPIFFMGGIHWERLFFSIVNFAILMFSGLLGGLALNTLVTALPDSQLVSSIYVTQETSWLAVLLAILCIIAYTLLVLVITRLNTEGKRFIPRKYWMGIMSSFAIIVAGLVILNNLNAWVREPKRVYTYVSVGSLGFLVIWVLLYVIFYFVCRYVSKTTEANVLAIQNDMIERYILRKQASDERIQVLSHDLKHSLVQWRTLAEEKGDTTALQSISEYEGQLLSSLLINVENENANAIVNQKCLEANQAQVEFQIDGVFHKDLFMSSLDLCSLLGNLLDNAIEAAAQVETVALRRVKLSIRRKGNLLIMMVENSYMVEPIIEDGVFITSKKDKNLHAIGMQSIRYVAEKYNGVVHNSFENNWFKATVMLSAYQNVLSSEF